MDVRGRKKDALWVEFAPFGSSWSYFSPISWLAPCYSAIFDTFHWPTRRSFYFCALAFHMAFHMRLLLFPQFHFFHFLTSSIALWGSFMKFDKPTRVNQTKTNFELSFFCHFNCPGLAISGLPLSSRSGFGIANCILYGFFNLKHAQINSIFHFCITYLYCRTKTAYEVGYSTAHYS